MNDVAAAKFLIEFVFVYISHYYLLLLPVRLSFCLGAVSQIFQLRCGSCFDVLNRTWFSTKRKKIRPTPGNTRKTRYVLQLAEDMHVTRFTQWHAKKARAISRMICGVVKTYSSLFAVCSRFLLQGRHVWKVDGLMSERLCEDVDGCNSWNSSWC